MSDWHLIDNKGEMAVAPMGTEPPSEGEAIVVSEGTPSEPPVVVREPSGLLKVCINYTSDSGKLITRVQVVKHETLNKVLAILDNEQVL